jgi:hypothetical protein
VNATQLHQAIMELPCKVQPEDFSAALELALAAGLPQWREKPTCVGWWVINYPEPHNWLTMDAQYITEDEMNDTWEGLSVYGPLPLPPEGEER